MSLRSQLRDFLEPIRHSGQFDVKTAISKGRVVTRTVAGKNVSWLITNAGDEIQCQQVRLGYYELNELEQLLKDVGPRQNILDVGANIGNHSVFFINHMDCSNLIAVEPFGAAVTHLLANLSLNYPKSLSFRLICGAFDESGGRGSIVPPTRFNIGLTRVEVGEGDVTVFKGDEEMGASRVDLIKIDVEGMETRVLKGLIQSISAHRPALYIETSDDSVTDVLAILRPFQYRVVREMRAYESQLNLTLLPC